jgi:hypothetical protein
MRPIARGRFGVEGTLITVVSAFLFLSTVLPSSAAARVVHSRTRRAVPKAAAPVHKAAVPVHREPAPAVIFNPDSEVLSRLQDGQTSLERRTADFNAAIQRRISQLRVEVGDAQRIMQQALEQTNQRLDSAQRLLKFMLAVLVFSLGGLLYVAYQLLRLQAKPIFKWKGTVPEADPHEEEIVSRRREEPVDGSAGKLKARKDIYAPPAPR